MEATLRPFQPTPERPWDRRRAAHLLRRAGFGPTRAEIDTAVADGPEKTVDRLLTAARGPDDPDIADWRSVERTLLATGEIESARAAWLMRMMHTGRPLLEKLTLFWHGHFATAYAKVADTTLMTGQIGKLRTLALGKFGPMLTALTADPAMIVWLDNNTNRRGHANENYAREIMELFSLGVGNYAEADIREAGRAFTGWHTDRKSFTFNAEQFDDGEKRFLGERGRFGGQDIVDICLKQPACARFIAGKLFRYFVHTKPTDAQVAELAAGFRADNLDIGKLLRRLLLCEEFYSPRAHRAIIKGPVELVVGTLRSLGAAFGAVPAVKAAGEMGQLLYDPPTVKGWDGGRLWLNSATVLVRTHFLQAVCRPGPAGAGLPLGELAKEHKLRSASEVVDFLLDVLVQSEVPVGTRDRLLEYAGGADAAVSEDKFRGLAQLVLSLPEYQVG